MRFLILLLFSTTAYASESYQDQAQYQDQEQQAYSEGSTASVGDVTGATVGNVSGGSVGDVNTSLSVKEEAGAPGIVIFSESGTAPYLRCVGGGGSTKDGSAGGWWCWLQKDIYAKVIMEDLASLGLFIPAAKSYCSRKLHYQNFENQDQCEAVVTKSLMDASLEVEDVGKFYETVAQTDVEERQTELEKEIAELRAELEREKIVKQRVQVKQARQIEVQKVQQQQQQQTFEAYIKREEDKKARARAYNG